MSETLEITKARNSRRIPFRFRLLGLLRKIIQDSKGAWVKLDLSKISVTLSCSKRHLQRCLNEIRDEEKMCREFVFRSANKTEGRGRMVLICSFDWYDENQREAFDRTANGKKRGLRESFQPEAELIEGVEFVRSRPSDIDKELAPKGAEFNNTRKSSSDSLRVLSFSFARQLLRKGWKDRFRRLLLTHNDLSKILHRAFRAGYWRDDIEKAAARAFRLADSATADGLARSPLAYASHLFKLELKKCRASARDCVERARKYWSDQVTLHHQAVHSLKIELGDLYQVSYPKKLISACERYGLEL